MNDHDHTGHLADVPNGDQRREKLGEEVDGILDEIDEVLEEHAEPFVRGYIIKGGQGLSAFFAPEFLWGAVAGGVAGNATYEMIKAALFRTFRAFRQINGPIRETTREDGSFLFEEDEQILAETYRMARLIPTSHPPQHGPEEAMAVHWFVFLRELHREAGFVQLRPDHYRKIVKAASKTPEQLQPSQLVARIIDEWLGRHPNAEIGSIGD